MKNFQDLYDLFASEEFLVAYANSKGGNYVATDVEVAKKAAALFGAYGAAYNYVLSQFESVTWERFVEALKRLAHSPGLLSHKMGSFNAHLTWLSCQPFLGREKIERVKQFTYSNLSEEEFQKDVEHFQHAARYLLNALGYAEPEPTLLAAE